VRLSIENWKDVEHDWNRCCDVVVMAKTSQRVDKGKKINN
jgi:uncharacterized protein YijF (DUF1287 family)